MQALEPLSSVKCKGGNIIQIKNDPKHTIGYIFRILL